MLNIDITNILDEFIIYNVSNIFWQLSCEKKVFKLWKWQILNINGLEENIVRWVSKSNQQEYFFKIIETKEPKKTKKTIIINEISEEEFNEKMLEKKKKGIIKKVLEKTWLLKKK